MTTALTTAPAPAWLPASACTPRCAADPVPTVDPALLRRHRWGRLAGALGRAGVASVRAPLTGPRGRRRSVVCAAARVLTAVGVRVEVHSSPVAWPRSGHGHGPGHLVVANHVSLLDGLALLTVVPGIPVAEREIGDWPVVGRLLRRTGVVLVDRAAIRTLPGTVGQAAGRLRAGTSVTVHPEGTTSCGVELGRFRPAFFQAAVDAAAPVCPVALRYRVDGGTASAVAAHPGSEPPLRTVARVIATRGLVVEVHLLPALDPAGADRRELAALAEYAIAAVTEAHPPVVTAHPHRPRVPASLLDRRARPSVAGRRWPAGPGPGRRCADLPPAAAAERGAHLRRAGPGSTWNSRQVRRRRRRGSRIGSGSRCDPGGPRDPAPARPSTRGHRVARRRPDAMAAQRHARRELRRGLGR